MAGFPLPPQVDPNLRVGRGDPQYGLHAFESTWHDLWTFLTTITQWLYADFRAIQNLSDGS